MATITWFRPWKSKHVEVLCPRLTKPVTMADTCSASSRPSDFDMAISSPSLDTATASVTPADFSTNCRSAS